MELKLVLAILACCSCFNRCYGKRKSIVFPYGLRFCIGDNPVDELHLDIPIAGLAKDDRHRTNELLFGFPPQTIALPPESELFKVLTQIQDEVHRYAITFHRDKRSKHALHSELDEIKGIGPKAKEALLSKFKSVKKMKEASLEQLSEVLGPHKAEILSKYFEEKGENMK